MSALGDLCLVPWESERVPFPAGPTALAVSPQSSFAASVKALVASATDAFHRWVAVFRGGVSGPSEKEALQLQRELLPAEAAASMEADWRVSCGEVQGKQSIKNAEI